MDPRTNQDVLEAAGNGQEIGKTDSDESCILIEKDISIVEIDDSFSEEVVEVDSSSSSNNTFATPDNRNSVKNDSQNMEQANKEAGSPTSNDCQEVDVTMNGDVSSSFYIR